MAPPEIAINAFGEFRSVINHLSTLGATHEQLIQGLSTTLVGVLLCRAQELEGGGPVILKLEDLCEAAQEAVNAIGDRLGIQVPA